MNTLFLNATIMVEFLQRKLAEAGMDTHATKLRALEITDHASAKVVHEILNQNQRPVDPELGSWWDLVKSNVERALPPPGRVTSIAA